MLIEFELSMPNRGSWNGAWSGENNYYGIIKNIPKAKAEKILERNGYSYYWNDGWSAHISVRQVDSKEAQRLRKKSKGFCNYDWMVRSIIYDNEINTRYCY